MKKMMLLSLIIYSITLSQSFDKYFENKGLRIDLFQSGNSEYEIITLKQLVAEKYFSGNKNKLVDNLNLGYYFVKVYNSQDEVIYSRGFSTLFQEWQTTKEAESIDKSFPISVKIPYPKENVTLNLYKRDKKNHFQSIYSLKIDPINYFIKSENIEQVELIKLHYSGDYSKKVDILFVPDGYAKSDTKKLKNDLERFSEYLLEYSPFSQHKTKINIWGLNLFSEESGTDIPGANIYKNTAIESSFYTFDSERYLTVTDIHNLSQKTSNVPYDYIIVLVNSEKYGGGGIYNFWAVTSVDNPKSELVMMHEFGHSFAGLADEYYTSDVSYEDYFDLNTEPWEKNITTLVDFELKWKNLLKKDTPIPTQLEDANKYPIGVYEGGGYVAKGVYRPSENSLMKTLGIEGFNEVSKNCIESIINHFSE